MIFCLVYPHLTVRDADGWTDRQVCCKKVKGKGVYSC